MMGGSIVQRTTKSYTLHIFCLLVSLAVVILALGNPQIPTTVYAGEEDTAHTPCNGDSFADTAGSIYDTSIRYRRKLCVINGVDNKFFPQDRLKKSDMIARMYRAGYQKTSSDTMNESITRGEFAQYLYDHIGDDRIESNPSLDTTIPIMQDIEKILHGYIYK